MSELEYVEEFYEISEVVKGKILNKYIKNNLEGKIHNYEQIVDTALNTVSQFTLVKGNLKKIVKVGLAFGKVQSGKTTYFLCVSACALDNGFDIIIILSGVTRNLFTQNKSRLKKSFRECKTFLSFYDSSDFTNKMSPVIEDIKDDFESYKDANVIGGVFISVLKEDSHLLKIQQIVNEFCDKRILIIDDEGDQFSMNTKVNKLDESSIYKYIKNVVSSSANVSLLSVTATPQANIFIDIFSQLSPEFVELVEPGQDYCGLETFHSNNDYISFVSGEQKDFTDDLRRAIIYYLFTIYETEFYHPNNYLKTKNWMLIHTSKYKMLHLKDFNELNDIFEYELGPLALSKDYSSLDIHKEEIVSRINTIYKDFNVSSTFGFPLETFFLKFKDVLRLIYIDSNQHNITIINSDEEEIETEADLQKTKYGILIGGDMLGRGITIDGLTVSYLTRDTVSGKGNIDTILQRARWFGYRRSILNLIKIFTTKEIQNKMIEIYQHDVSLYEEIKYCVNNNIPIKDSKIPVPVGKNMEVTRKNIIKKGSIYRFATSNFIQQRKVMCDIDYSVHNQVNQALISVLRKSEFITTIKGIKEYTVVSRDFMSSISLYLSQKSVFSLNERLYESIKEILNKNEKITVYVIKEYSEDSKGYSLTKVIQSGVDKERSVYVGNVLSGSSAVYKGDLYHFNDKDHIQIHFTRIRDENNNDIYSGKKILFLCVNNKSITANDYVQRR